MTQDAAALVDEGRVALAGCDWTSARSCYAAALELDESPDALDGLGQALYWLGEYRRALSYRERAYGVYRERGERRRAAFVAVQLAQLHGLLYGNDAAVSGWVGHALRMLEECGDCPELGWVELFRGCIAPDPVVRERHARVAVELGRRFDTPDLEFDALGYLGKARVENGAIHEGMALIDEAVAAVAGGLVADPWPAGEIYCSLFHACEMIVDVTRAEGWLGAVDGYVERTGELPISAICRMHYGGILTAAGRYDDAEHELTTALGIYEDTYRGSAFEALQRLADLRVRQGRFEEAARLLEGHEERPGALLPRVRLLLHRGEPEVAQAVLDRHLREAPRAVPEGPALALAVDVASAVGDVERARRCAGELERLATASGLPSIRGLAARARAQLAGAEVAEAAHHLDDAVVALSEAQLPYELAVARRELAVLVARERPEVARSEARAALTGFQRIGASREADATARLLRQLGERRRSWPRSDGTLTARQREVLDLLAEGLSNAQIAERLYISPRTAEHHVSNILAALNVTSRTEAAAYALRRPKGAST